MGKRKISSGEKSPDKRMKEDIGDDNEAMLSGEEDEVENSTPGATLIRQQKREINKIAELLKQAWKDAPLATFNPDIHSVLTGEWDNLIFPGHDDQSLQEILYCEEGWTGTGLLEIVGNSTCPIPIYPLGRKDCRILWTSLRYRRMFENKKQNARFAMELPEEWLAIKLKSKSQVFQRNNCTDYAKKLAADISYNQTMFFGRKEYWFQPLCENLGWDLSDNFMERFIICLLCVCADPALIQESTKPITESFSSSGGRGKVKKAMVQAVKKAQKEKNILYPETFELFLNIRPSLKTLLK